MAVLSSLAPLPYNVCMSLPHTGIGRPVEVAMRVQKLKATVWLAENFPLSLQEQIMPIIDLMVSDQTALCVSLLVSVWGELVTHYSQFSRLGIQCPTLVYVMFVGSGLIGWVSLYSF